MLRRPIYSEDREKVVAGGVSEWIIAVVVVGLASLVFVIAFGTTMVRIHTYNNKNRRRRSSSSLTSSILIIHHSHMTPPPTLKGERERSSGSKTNVRKLMNQLTLFSCVAAVIAAGGHTRIAAWLLLMSSCSLLLMDDPDESGRERESESESNRLILFSGHIVSTKWTYYS